MFLLRVRLRVFHCCSARGCVWIKRQGCSYLWHSWLLGVCVCVLLLCGRKEDAFLRLVQSKRGWAEKEGTTVGKVRV